MATLLFSSSEDPPELWLPALQAEMPDLEIRVDPEIGDKADIDYALTYYAPHGLLASLPNLRFIHSISAGIDHLASDPDLPRHVQRAIKSPAPAECKAELRRQTVRPTGPDPTS